MDAPAGPTPYSLILQELRHHAVRWDFFQAVRRIECARRDLPRIGASSRAAEDPVRFAEEPSLAFAGSTLAALEESPSPPRPLSLSTHSGTSGLAAAEKSPVAPPRLCVRFFGVFGPNGPLPLHLTEYAHQQRLHHNDPTFAHFADLFHHRLLSFFYRAWASQEQTVSFDRSSDDGPGELEQDAFAVYVASFIGLGGPEFLRRDSVADLAKLYYSGRLAGGTRPPEGLQAILADYLGLPTRLEEFTGQWLRIPEPLLCRLGQSLDSGRLGRNLIAGRRLWDRQSKFTIHLGPMDFAAYERLLPGAVDYRRVADWVRLYVGDELAWSLRLILHAVEVPRIELGRAGRMGYTTWLRSGPSHADVDNVLTGRAAA